MTPQNGRAKQSPPYIIVAIVVVGLAGLGGAATVLILQGEAGIAAAGVITSFAMTIIVTLVGVGQKQTHDLVNSTSMELLEKTESLARAEGKVEGIAQEAAEPARQSTI